MNKLLIVFIFYSLNIKAETIALPPSVSSIDDIISEFRNTFTTKIIDLGKNFIALQSDKTIIFTNSTSLKCNGDTIAAGEPVSSMQYNFKKTENELIEKSTYTGCRNQISLIEDIVTRGGKLEPLKYSDFVKGKRDFDLKDNENYRLYRLTNSDNEEIFKMVIEKSDKAKLVEFYFIGQKFLRMNFDYQSSSTRLTLTYYGYKGKYVRKYSTWEFDNTFDPYTNTVLVTKATFNQVNYMDMYGGPLSQSDYISRFNMRVISGPLAKVRSIVDYHNYYFPTTNVVQTGSINGHLKEELRLNINRLQNNTDINLVKIQLQEYMNAAEAGLIIDNRPTQ